MTFENLSPARPRLMANSAAIERVKEAIAKDKTGRGEKLLRKMLEAADAIVAQPQIKPESVPADPALRATTDILAVARAALQSVQMLGMAHLMTATDTYLAAARRDLATICGFVVWHGKDHFIDAAEMTHAAAIGYDWLFNHLSDDEKRTIAAAIIEKGLKPGLADLTGAPNPPWPYRQSNWNIVGNGGLMIGALALAEFDRAKAIDPDTTRLIFELCRKSVRIGFSGYSPQGGWDEGPGYWTYATEYAAYLISALETALGSDFGLAASPGLRDAGLFRLYAEGPAGDDSGGGRLLFNYSDSPETRSGSWVVRWLARRFDVPVYNWIAFQKTKATAMDLLWFSPDPPDPGAAHIPLDRRFDGTGVAVLRGHWMEDATQWLPKVQPTGSDVEAGITYLAVRGGPNTYNNHHGHLDLGSFVLDANRVRWATDLPPNDSAPDGCKNDYLLDGYFDLTPGGPRFTYYRTGTAGHNTLLVNNRNQQLEIEAPFKAFHSTRELAIAVLDLTAAYADVNAAARGFAMVDRRHVVIVDEFTPTRQADVVWQMHTRATVALQGRSATLTQKDTNGAVQDFFLQILSDGATEFALDVPDIQKPQAPNDGISKLVIKLPAVTGRTRLAVYLSPDTPTPKDLPDLLGRPLADWVAWAKPVA
jgi:Heparinase II/III-like protein